VYARVSQYQDIHVLQLKMAWLGSQLPPQNYTGTAQRNPSRTKHNERIFMAEPITEFFRTNPFFLSHSPMHLREFRELPRWNVLFYPVPICPLSNMLGNAVTEQWAREYCTQLMTRLFRARLKMVFKQLPNPSDNSTKNIASQTAQS